MKKNIPYFAGGAALTLSGDEAEASPIKAITKPTMFFIDGISFNKKNAIIIPNGTSSITRRTAEDASIIFNPV